jgi:hypothetical protein
VEHPLHPQSVEAGRVASQCVAMGFMGKTRKELSGVSSLGAWPYPPPVPAHYNRHHDGGTLHGCGPFGCSGPHPLKSRKSPL